ncbi:MAG: Rpn family recombination-promoting nuclease/putative transposase [Dysgonamonadaceae bacterium]|jgi:hypothetical protein|nr:Rpn family recombination-promoting nuclease/putative transposase [Dysgonamonadaceae bacterium]
MGRYLDPKNDLPFKRIFGKHPGILKSFLNTLMPLEKHQSIESLEYLTEDQVPENPANKNSIVDVRCTDNCGRQFIVEMQVYWNSARTGWLSMHPERAITGLDEERILEILKD